MVIKINYVRTGFIKPIRLSGFYVLEKHSEMLNYLKFLRELEIYKKQEYFNLLTQKIIILKKTKNQILFLKSQLQELEQLIKTKKTIKKHSFVQKEIIKDLLLFTNDKLLMNSKLISPIMNNLNNTLQKYEQNLITLNKVISEIKRTNFLNSVINYLNKEIKKNIKNYKNRKYPLKELINQHDLYIFDKFKTYTQNVKEIMPFVKIKKKYAKSQEYYKTLIKKYGFVFDYDFMRNRITKNLKKILNISFID